MRKIVLGVLVVLSVACGGSSPSQPSVPAPPPTPSAVVNATGSGALILHPSRVSAFALALETPIRITESAGGSADWGFARMQIFNRGREVERRELTANDIRAAGFGRIAANTNPVYRAVFRFNSSDFDEIEITLGFSDVKDGRQFNTEVPFNSFSRVDVDFTPAGAGYSRDPL